MFIFNSHSGQYHSYLKDPGNPYGLGDYEIIDIFVDQQGIVWIGTNWSGLHYFDQRKSHFKHHWNHPLDSNSLNDDIILHLFEDRKGITWIGTRSGGLNRYDSNKGQFQHFLHDPDDPNSLSSNLVQFIYEDSRNKLWVSTSDPSILHQFDQSKKTFKKYRYDHNNPNSLSDGGNFPIFEDSNGVLWISSRDGINRFDPKTEYFKHYLSDKKIRAICEDHQGFLWLGVDRELIRFDPITLEQKEYLSDSKDSTSLNSNSVRCIYESRDSILWVAGDGLIKFDRQTETFRHFTENDGLINNVVGGILEDNNGFLWMQTNKGLAKFDPRLERFYSYDVHDGLQSNEFNGRAFHKSTLNGEMYFGGINGFNVFHPDSIHDNTYVPPVVFTAFRYFNKKDIEGKAIEIKGITAQKEITLDYNENMFTCEFAALNYSNPFKNQYAYNLEGVTDSWIQLGTKRELTFTNLNPGNYTLQIKGSNNNGVWNEEGTSLKITILPPWWQTWWAKTLYIIAAISIILGYIRWRTYSLRTRQKELEQTVTERTAEVVAEKEVSDQLLLNILPAETAEELKQYGSAKAKNYDTVTVLFTDFKDFTMHSERLSAKELVAEIDYCFKAFDLIMDEYNVEKIKTIGDAYMAAAGLPTPNTSNPEDAVKAALAIRDFMQQYKAERESKGRVAFEIRIGVHTGPVVAGIVGIKKFAYDIWGDTVNLAARMETSGEVGKVNVSQSTYEHLQGQPEFSFISRGKINAKNKGEVEMYFVENSEK